MCLESGLLPLPVEEGERTYETFNGAQNADARHEPNRGPFPKSGWVRAGEDHRPKKEVEEAGLAF